ncbi:nuclear transport factor 2 family protein [Bernardetia sp.]|uniref:nuclear transport factor 2 family protein n=1 Tax=Bernardetia sp. TaxID=1937974 RepID=UPI0025BB0ED2|nr:nuclear transport factor 2 family protein [Bernardetia sp.]
MLFYKKFILSFIFVVFLGSTVIAQSPIDSLSETDKEVILPIEQLFEGMLKGDSSLIRQAFYENANLKTVIKDKNDNIVLRVDSLENLLNAVATPHEKPYREKILSYEIKTDENLAQVWTPYKFYVGETFSHCGANAFHLIKTKEGWKIISITDTRHREGCE